MSVEQEHPDAAKPILDVFIAPLGDEARRHCAALARELRAAGLSVELSTDQKLKRALEVANKTGARYALIVGDNEISAGTYQLKDMTSGEQHQVSRDQIASMAGRK